MIQANTVRITPSLDFVAPAQRRFDRGVIALIELAAEMEDVGHATAAKELIVQLEERLGVTEHHRIAATSAVPAGPFLLATGGAAVSNSIRAKKTIRLIDERRRAIALIPRDIPPLTEKDRFDIQTVEQKLDEAQKHREVGNRRLAKIRVIEARRILVAVEESRRGRLDANWAERVLGEIEALEISIGGTVERKPLNGGQAYQLSSRDGIYALTKSPGKLPDGTPKPARLNSFQSSVGLAYRNLYEKTDPERSLKPKSIDPSEQMIGRGGEGWEEKRAELWNARKRIDARITAAVGPRGLWLLQEVAGKGRCLAHFTAGGRPRERDTLLLVRALDEAAFALGY